MSEMVLNLAGRQADSRVGAGRHAAEGTGSERSERVRSPGDRPERNADEATADGTGEFPRLLDLLIERHNPSLQTDHFARQVLQANQRALANQRITDDDLRVMDDATRGEDSGLERGSEKGRASAVAIERAEMGKSGMAFFYRPNSADAARLLQANAERASGPGADPGKSDPGLERNADRGERPAPSRSTSGPAPEVIADGRSLADVVQAKTTGRMPAMPAFSAALNSAAVRRTAVPGPVPKTGGTKSSPEAARLARTLPTVSGRSGRTWDPLGDPASYGTENEPRIEDPDRERNPAPRA